jgi:hypothetical protein
VGRIYLIESAEDLNNPKWIPQERVLLERSPHLWLDTRSPGATRRFYRAVLQE